MSVREEMSISEEQVVAGLQTFSRARRSVWPTESSTTWAWAMHTFR